MSTSSDFARFENIAPSRLQAAFVALGCAAFLALGGLAQSRVSILEWFFAALLLCVLLGSLSAIFFRGAWIYGLELRPNGFIFQAPLRRPKLIEYCAIERIVASAIVDGYGESSVTLHLKTTAGRAWVTPQLLYRTGVLDALLALPGFDHAAWAISNVPEDSLWRSVIPKRTAVFSKVARHESQV